MPIEAYLNELALLGAILLTSVSQTLLRAGARNKIKSVDILFNSATLVGYLFFFVVIFLSIFAMQEIDLKTVVAWNATAYVLTPVISRLLIREPLDKRIMSGSAVIVVGLLVFVL